MKALTPEMPAIFFSADEDEGKVLVMAQVPTSVIKDKGLKANEWCQQVSTIKRCYLTKQTIKIVFYVGHSKEDIF